MSSWVRNESLLTTNQMASFAARGFLRFDNLVPAAINLKVMALFASKQVERPVAGKPLSETYPPDSPLAELMQLPAIQA